MIEAAMFTHNLTFSTVMRFKTVPPYDFEVTVQKPAGWHLATPYEIFEKGTLWTALRIHSGKVFGLKLSSLGTIDSADISCKLYSNEKLEANEKRELHETLKWMLDLEEDITRFYALAKHDTLVRILVRDLYGMRITKNADLFSRLILALTLQMAPIKRSDQMMSLLIKEFGERIRFDGKEVLYWPSPARIAKAQVGELEEKCKLGYRAKSLKGIAESLIKDFPSPQELEMMVPEEAKAKLMELKGIGEYSADIVSPHPGFALDVWSAKIFSLLLYGVKPESPRDEISKLKKIAEKRWGRWRGYVFTYVLNDLNNLSTRFNLNLTEV
jgi:DNA-3-methyladenine glycosylase II